MTDRAWATVRAAAEQLLHKERSHSGTGRDGHLGFDDMKPLLEALALPTDDGVLPPPDTWITVKGTGGWWVHPAGETDPTKAQVWIARLQDGRPVHTEAYRPDVVENWEGFPWEGRAPTVGELRRLTEHVIATLGFLGAGPTPADPLTEAADAIRDHIRYLVAEVDRRRDGERGDTTNAYEDSLRGGLGGIYGDFGAAFNPDVAEQLAVLLTALATQAPTATIEAAAGRLATCYLAARTRDDERHH